MRVTTYLAVFEYDDMDIRRWTLYSGQRQIGMGSNPPPLTKPFEIAAAAGVEVQAIVTWHTNGSFTIRRSGSLFVEAGSIFSLTGNDLHVTEHDDGTTSLEVR